jgi:hypothetical protein
MTATGGADGGRRRRPAAGTGEPANPRYYILPEQRPRAASTAPNAEIPFGRSGLLTADRDIVGCGDRLITGGNAWCQRAESQACSESISNPSRSNTTASTSATGTVTTTAL